MSYSLSKKFTFSSLIMFALPTTIMMLVTSLYSILDGVFVSRFVGTNALSSTNIAFPAVNVILGVAIMLASGSNAIIARKLGEGHFDSARKTFTMILTVGLALGILLSVIGNLFIVPLVRMLGASDLLLEDCIRYLRIQLWAAPAMILQILFQSFFVTEGKPGLGLFITIVAGLTNGILDFIFIVPMGMGVTGASLATAIGYLIPTVFGLIYFLASRKMLWLVQFRLSMSELLEACINGSSEMVTNLSSGIITFLFNLIMMKFAGEDGVAAITIIQYSQFLLSAIILGFSQGISPVISFNYGSKNTAQLKQIFRTAFTVIALTSVLVFGLSEAYGHVLVAIFAPRGSNVYQLASHGFLIFALSFLFSGFSIMASALFTSLGDGKTSAIISFVRTLGLIVISLLILPSLFGMNGVWMAIPVAEAGALILSARYIWVYKNRYQYL